MARVRFSPRLMLLVTGLALGACGPGRNVEQTRAARGSSKVGGQVVSTVDGYAITVADVEALARAGQMSAREALARLQEERLLMIESERRGFAKTSDVDEVARKARVQALLDAEAAAVVVSDEDIRTAYEKQKGRFEKSERRASVHVLAQLPRTSPSPEADAAAKAFIQGVIREMRDATDLDAFCKQQSSRSTAQFQVTCEKIPAVDHGAPFVKPYLDALFSTLAPGMVLEPVRTVFGWHALRVTEILPAESTPYDKAAEQLRAELLTERRKARVDALLVELRKTYGVQIADNAAATLASLAH
jgi:peptidyl-prolyl cis-trans isomerase C